ncbi:REST corepressor 1 isoform X4 [Vanessa tameamea]|uniref:REST corepressor 1 isoform X4 n=1 Tax=Vanessa tameamea TaxID=334116 RepID=A0A8B8IC10_VANTA|nr:REST corepressor 1 isoform X3 [Vanessa tameamea]XP_047534028.1 REST corepressor 1 isoform X1 [Vanessa atalanta]
MVLAERSNDVRNGKRSRGPSPNGHGSPDSSSEDENVVPFAAEKIRVGRDYQAVCPELEPLEQRKPDQISDRALLVWSPTSDISDIKLDEYITIAKEKYGYNGEQALGMLFWHKHDLNRASMDLANFTPFPDEWTVEDKVLFEQAFQFHGKSFHRIRQMLPDKSIASLVKYYYSWKKTRARTSLMDVVSEGRNPTGSGSGKRESGAGSEPGGSDKDSDNDEKGEGGGEAGKWCTVCGILCSQTTPHNSHKLCQACLVHARRTGTMRPLCGPSGRRGPGSKQQRYKHRLPRGIYINHDDLVAMATGPQPGEPAQPGLVNQGEAMLKAMDREIISLKRQVQQNKQQLSAMKRKVGDAGVEELRPGEPPAKINSRWTNDELLMAVTAVRKYGKDFQAIAETLGTKTEAHIRTFFISYRRRYNLDAVLREHEADRGSANHIQAAGTTSTESTDNDVDNSNANNGTGSPQTNTKDEKTEVDSEGVAIGASAEQGGPPTTPPKHKPSK